MENRQHFDSVLSALKTILRTENLLLEQGDITNVARLQRAKIELTDEYESISGEALKALREEAGSGSLDDFHSAMFAIQELRQLTRRNIILLNERKLVCAQNIMGVLEDVVASGRA